MNRHTPAGVDHDKSQGRPEARSLQTSPQFFHGEEILEAGEIHETQRRNDEYHQEEGFYQSGPGDAVGWHVTILTNYFKFLY